MILCSCRVISNTDIKTAVIELQDKYPDIRITTESVASILEKPYIEGNCLICVPLIKQEIRKILENNPLIQKYEHAS